MVKGGGKRAKPLLPLHTQTSCLSLSWPPVGILRIPGGEPRACQTSILKNRRRPDWKLQSPLSPPLVLSVSVYTTLRGQTLFGFTYHFVMAGRHKIYHYVLLVLRANSLRAWELYENTLWRVYTDLSVSSFSQSS